MIPWSSMFSLPDSISRRSMFSPSHTSHPRHFSTPWGHDLLMVCCDMSECWTSWYDNASFSRCCKRSAATNLRLWRNDHNFTTEETSLAITGTMCGGLSKIVVALEDRSINPQLCSCYPLWSFGLPLFWKTTHIYTWPKIKLFSVHLVACWRIAEALIFRFDRQANAWDAGKNWGNAWDCQRVTRSFGAKTKLQNCSFPRVIKE